MADALAEMIRRVLRDAPFAMRQLAADAGLSYDVLRSWRSGRRRPSRASAQRLAAGLEGRGERLLLLAKELRAASEDGGGRGVAAAEDEATVGGEEEALAARSDGTPPHGDPLQETGTTSGARQEQQERQEQPERHAPPERQDQPERQPPAERRESPVEEADRWPRAEGQPQFGERPADGFR